MPVVSAALRADDHGGSGSAANVRIRLRGLHGEFPNYIGRKVLQEAADVVVRIVGAVHRELVVQPGASTSGHRGNARLGRVGRLDRLRARHHVGNVSEAAGRQRNGLQVLARNDSSINGIRGIEHLGSDGGRFRLHINGLLNGFRTQRDQDVAHVTHLHRHIGTGLGKPFGIDGYAVVSRHQVGKSELSAAVGGCLAGNAGSIIRHHDIGGLDSSSAGILHFAQQRARRILRAQRERKQSENADCQ